MFQNIKEKVVSLANNFFVDYKLLFYILLTVHFLLVCIGLHHSISDLHSFRQTQTALTSYYFLKEGFQINYITPVVGYPWQIPFEFPTYQILVSAISKVTHLDLELTGRLVSISAFYGCIAVLFQFKKVIKSFPSYLSACLILCNPIYIFWSRTFLIESTALLLCIYFIYLTIVYYEKGKNKLLFLLLIIGTLGILTKVTTFLVGIGLLFLLLVHRFRNNQVRYKKRLLLLSSILLLLFILLFIWTHHCDKVKSLSLIGKEITSSKLNLWNFGFLSQRFEIENWSNLFYNSSYILFLSLLIIGAILLRSKIRKQHIIAMIWLVAGISGPMIFFNLYSIHDYYHYANTLFLLIGIAYFISQKKEIASRRNWTISLVCFSLWTYYIGYSQVQKIDNVYFKNLGAFVESNTNANDIIMVVGSDWSSEIPYYSHRKCICVPSWMMDSLKVSPKKFIHDLNTPDIKHLLLTGYCKDDFQQDYCQKLGPILGLNSVLTEDKSKSILFSLRVL